jgi:GAF domain-containing protein
MCDSYDFSVLGSTDPFGLLLEAQHVGTFLQSITEQAVAEIDPTLIGGLTARQQGRYLTVACTEPRASVVDLVQYRHRSGPCVDALEDGREVLSEEVSEDDRWGEFRWHALANGIRSLLSTPVTVRGGTVAAFTLYAPTVRAFGHEKRAAAAAFAEAAATAIALALRLAEQEQLTEQLQRALVSRSVIGQALGIIMSGRKIDADEAFDVLRSASQEQNVKVREIAARLVHIVTGKPPIPPATAAGHPGIVTPRGAPTAVLGEPLAARDAASRGGCGVRRETG